MSTLLLRTLRGVTSCNPTGGCDRFVLSFKTSGWDRGVISRSISSFLGSRQNPAQATILFRVTSRRIEVLSRRPNVRFKFDFSGKKQERVKRPTFLGDRRPRTSIERNKTTFFYMLGLAILTTGLSYAAVPLYRMFCQASGYGGTTRQVGHGDDKVELLKPNKERRIKVRFQADTAATMQWNFRPQQTEVTLYAGETALAFYTAKNPTPSPIDGISTYNVIPFEAGQYFNKIQCFCFEEQRLNPGEEVDMPVFFYIDPEFLEDPFLEEVDEIHLSYTFFESKPGLQLPTPYQK